ncbi:MAG: hypothetical protein P0S94_00395 [Simkaniaceae bacterium]|nr:hypothetical protein [Simkaniaceae bacterium]
MTTSIRGDNTQQYTPQDINPIQPGSLRMTSDISAKRQLNFESDPNVPRYEGSLRRRIHRINSGRIGKKPKKPKTDLADIFEKMGITSKKNPLFGEAPMIHNMQSMEIEKEPTNDEKLLNALNAVKKELEELVNLDKSAFTPGTYTFKTEGFSCDTIEPYYNGERVSEMLHNIMLPVSNIQKQYPYYDTLNNESMKSVNSLVAKIRATSFECIQTQ